MDKAERLRRAGEQILADAEGFCDRAEDTLNDLEAWGQEPTLEMDWLSGVVPEELYYFEAGKLVATASGLPELPRKVRVRSSRVEVVDASVDVSEVLGLAHAEDPKAWQSAIALALDSQAQPVRFWALVEATGLRPGELLLGLLLGGWALSQEEFYGELLCEKN